MTNQNQPPKPLFCVALAVLCLLATVAVSADEPKPRPEALEVAVAGEIVRDKAVAEQLPQGRFFADADAFAAWWEKLGLEAEDLPEVDFTQSFICIETRDAADPNRVRWMGRKNDDGEAEVMGITTLIGFQPSNEIKLTLLAVDREGVKSLVRLENVVDEDGKNKHERRVYPLEPEEEKPDPKA